MIFCHYISFAYWPCNVFSGLLPKEQMSVLVYLKLMRDEYNIEARVVHLFNGKALCLFHARKKTFDQTCLLLSPTLLMNLLLNVKKVNQSFRARNWTYTHMFLLLFRADSELAAWWKTDSVATNRCVIHLFIDSPTQSLFTRCRHSLDHLRHSSTRSSSSQWRHSHIKNLLQGVICVLVFLDFYVAVTHNSFLSYFWFKVSSVSLCAGAKNPAGTSHHYSYKMIAHRFHRMVTYYMYVGM